MSVQNTLRSKIMEQLETKDKIAIQNEPELHGLVLSMKSKEIIDFHIESKKLIKLSEEGEKITENGSPEKIFFDSVSDGQSIDEIDSNIYALKNGWIKIKDKQIYKQVSTVEDSVRKILTEIKQNEYFVEEIGQKTGNLSDKDFKALKKRNLFILEDKKTYIIVKSTNFYQNDQEFVTTLTSAMIASGEYKNVDFKPYNFKTALRKESGSLHPLRKVQTEIRNIFLELGFTEMPTNNYVESSFWNFDALFQPQNHSAREMHDTFFISDPSTYENPIDPDLLKAVKEQHEKSYLYDWSEKEARKNILRTHTTASSAKMLYKIAEDAKKAGKELESCKLFSIDRVFRNESVDATHLAEFHQIEGLVLGKNLSIGHLMGVLNDFFIKLGLKDVSFKPTYNPYTEPSLEVFAYHEGLGKLIEVGNSGIFRPEMLEPLGISGEWRVIAWGLSLERPAMIKYGLNNIRELLGHKSDLKFIKDSPICFYK
ncbi:phenylalanine-tRNA synthetase, alpha subunit [Pseudoloma neurophilia]|uniref:phenylalanine--tRNA ligase n=1 Tax=Pseudoloma neurophilia TaxID=146866 RepID=A0A0R0M5F8_9MICR|nr:phenylalanine-tRNA synthetase, alpha subunit [Pseudoloma neurophilia]